MASMSKCDKVYVGQPGQAFVAAFRRSLARTRRCSVLVAVVIVLQVPVLLAVDALQLAVAQVSMHVRCLQAVVADLLQVHLQLLADRPRPLSGRASRCRACKCVGYGETSPVSAYVDFCCA